MFSQSPTDDVGNRKNCVVFFYYFISRVLQLNKNISLGLRHGRQRTRVLTNKFYEVYQQTPLGFHKRMCNVHIAEASHVQARLESHLGLNSQVCMYCSTNTPALAGRNHGRSHAAVNLLQHVDIK